MAATTLTSITHIAIDGSVLEGGGQILRNSISLSALLYKHVSIHKIRNGRQPPGLKNQHRTGLQLAAEIASGRLSGASNGSVDVDFVPGRICSGTYTADSVTAGSTTLLLQISLPLLLFSRATTAVTGRADTSEPEAPPPSILTLLGGTNATQAPQIDYTQNVFLPFVRRHFGVEGVEMEVRRRGYFPKGGGEVHVSVVPARRGLKAIRLLERGRVVAVGGIAHFAGLPGSVGRDMVLGARGRLKEVVAEELGIGADGEFGVPVKIEYKREMNSNSRGAGSGIVLWAELEGGGMIGGSAVGRKGIDPGKVGEEAANELVRGLQQGGCVDEWLQDQIILFMALAHGTSEVKYGTGGLSLHARTAIWVAQQLTEAKFEVVEEPLGHTIVRCEGVGYVDQERYM